MVDGSGTSAGMARNDGALPALPKTRNALLRGPSCALDLTKLALAQPQGAAAAHPPPTPGLTLLPGLKHVRASLEPEPGAFGDPDKKKYKLVPLEPSRGAIR